jgi:hypothetical protein
MLQIFSLLHSEITEAGCLQSLEIPFFSKVFGAGFEVITAVAMKSSYHLEHNTG